MNSLPRNNWAVFALVAVLLVALYYAAPILPGASFFWMPSIVYLFVIAVFLTSRGGRVGGGILWIAVALPIGFVLAAQILVLQQGVPTRWLAWGRFPLGDAADFLSGSVRILTEGSFVTIRGRPLANSFIGGLWQLTGFDLALLSIAVTTLCAIAAVFLGRALLSGFGLLAGGIGVAVSLDFLHEHIGAASTEPLGFFLGAAAAALLLSAALTRSMGLFILGVFALAVTFLYRVGAVFVLPFLLLWPFLVLSRWGQAIKVASYAGAAIILAAGLHIAVTKTISPDSPSFVNAPKSWYAIIAMGDEFLGHRPVGSVREEARWVQIFDDHPGLKDLPIDQQGAQFVAIVWEAALARPASVLAGAALEYADQLGRAGLFRFVDNKPFRLLVFLLYGVGLISAVLAARRHPMAAMLALAGIGQLLSIPFLHGGENRIHIGLAGIMAATVSYGALTLESRIFRRKRNDTAEQRIDLNASVLPILLPVFALGVSLFTGFVSAGKTGPDGGQSCGQGSSVALGAGSIIAVGAPREAIWSLSFQSASEMKGAAERWVEIGGQSNAVFYAPINERSVIPYIPQEGEGAVFSAYIADLTQGSSYPTFLTEGGIMNNGSGCLTQRP